MSHRAKLWPVVLASAVWAAAYQLAWGASWFGFMREEWAAAAASAGTPLPWTEDFWIIWVPLSIPFGAAVMAYAADGGRNCLGRSVRAALVLWCLSAIGMTASVLDDGYSVRIAALDAAVNFVAIAIASLLGAAVMLRLGRRSGGP